MKPSRHQPSPTPARILTAAHSCVAALGFHAATIREIAQWAQLGEGTLFRHFTDKSAILAAAFEHAAELLHEPCIYVPPNGTVYELFKGLWNRTAQRAANHREAFHYWRLYRATPLDTAWSAPEALQLGPFSHVPLQILEARGRSEFYQFDAWLMTSQWSAAVQFILAACDCSPGPQAADDARPTPNQTLAHAYEAWWLGFRMDRDAPIVYPTRTQH
jgi:AcrR family transcriptional regulator